MSKVKKVVNFIFLLLLVLYPLRHLQMGVDLWDGGYNYSNFRYPGTEYMDPMWYFATWISTEAGAFMMRLPFADTMPGMNLYTGMIVSLLAAAGFFFSLKCLKLPAWLAFLSQLTACGLCWLPTSALYNYLTFLLLMAGTFLLYQGLIKEKNGYLAAAGVLLGLNVGVRFSNLVQTGLILSVWGFCLLKKDWKGIRKKTLFCLAGYAGALGLMLLWISLRYGPGEYFRGIARLFSMTEIAEDYAPAGMLTSAFQVYFEEEILYFGKRFALVLALGTGICLIFPGKALRLKKAVCAGMTAALYGWLLTHRFYYGNFTYYDSVYAPCVLLLLFSLAVSVFFLFKKDVTDDEKLLALMEIPTILAVSLGGNNVVYYNINNMFLTFPFLLAMLWKLWKLKEPVFLFPLKAAVSVLALLVCVLAFRFGGVFVYEEADGARDMSGTVAKIPVLQGMKTGEEKVRELEGLYVYLQENGLLGRECILYGGIPGISYYMGLPPALNIWGDLRSYTPAAMSADLEKLRGELDGGAREPIAILDRKWADYMERPGEEEITWDHTALKKLELIGQFLAQYGYERTFRNEKYVIYEKNAIN